MFARSQRSSAISPSRSRKQPAQPAVPAPAKRSDIHSSVPSSTPFSTRPSSPGTTYCAVPSPCSSPAALGLDRQEAGAPDTTAVTTAKLKENVTVTVRFRPLSSRETSKGDEVAWYADGDSTVRNEYHQATCYAFDRVFGPATTTRRIYDIAALHVVSGAMKGINGTVFAYGVTSSGKTHTMHGEQTSPGIIPLAVKDIFGIIQETPEREFLLRVSYLEIYNEVINDLLDPTGQNLRIREDSQGTYVEGIKEEVVLSPAHALSLIASGEEHRHVGSNNYNLLSSRSHTMFTLTIESSPHGKNQDEEDVTLSQLHLIDLAGSESSKIDTTGTRRKEGSYINKSLLTLGTVISKLTEAKATHIPYRDSKLTRLLQSTLSGHGRVSLICTVTPASSNSEETHNTLKFAQRCKHVEIKASQNKIMDEKSLIKKYQKEISGLERELQQLSCGMMHNSPTSTSGEEDSVNLQLKLEACQVKVETRLEEEEEAKAALIGRIQRLKKLILVSTKKSIQTTRPGKPTSRPRHSFGEDELAYLPGRRREFMVDDEGGSLASEPLVERRSNIKNIDEKTKIYKGNKRNGMLSWFKPKSRGMSSGSDSQSSASGSPASASKYSQKSLMNNDISHSKRMSISRRGNDLTAITFPEKPVAGDPYSPTSAAGHRSQTGATITDQLDLQDQLQMKDSQIAEMQETILVLSQQLSSLSEKNLTNSQRLDCNNNQFRNDVHDDSEAGTPTSVMGLSRIFSQETKDINDESLLNSQLKQIAVIENLKQENAKLAEEKNKFESQNQKLLEEASYAKELASAAAIELKNLAEEVSRLSCENAKLCSENFRSNYCQGQRSSTPYSFGQDD